MAKHTLAKAGIKRVCPFCASTDVILDVDSVGGKCKGCGMHADKMLEMSFVEVSHFKRELVQRHRLREFSLIRCDELHALLFVLMAVVIVAVFILVARSRWGLW